MKMVTVCDKCLRASCWQGQFLCDEALDAGTVQMERQELINKKLENEEYLLTDEELLEKQIQDEGEAG